MERVVAHPTSMKVYRCSRVADVEDLQVVLLDSPKAHPHRWNLHCLWGWEIFFFIIRGIKPFCLFIIGAKRSRRKE